MAPDLIVIVPRNLRSRASTLGRALTGTNIRVVVDRRIGERRAGGLGTPAERRLGDRRSTARVVAYVYACPVIEVDSPPRPAQASARASVSPARAPIGAIGFWLRGMAPGSGLTG
jgi:hypothetical protein